MSEAAVEADVSSEDCDDASDQTELDEAEAVVASDDE